MWRRCAVAAGFIRLARHQHLGERVEALLRPASVCLSVRLLLLLVAVGQVLDEVTAIGQWSDSVKQRMLTLMEEQQSSVRTPQTAPTAEPVAKYDLAGFRRLEAGTAARESLLQTLQRSSPPTCVALRSQSCSLRFSPCSRSTHRVRHRSLTPDQQPNQQPKSMLQATTSLVWLRSRQDHLETRCSNCAVTHAGWQQARVLPELDPSQSALRAL